MSNSLPVTTTTQPAPALFVGIDWADQKHDVYWFAADGRKGQQVIEQSPERIEELLAFLAKMAGGGRVALALEKSRGPLYYALMGREQLLLYLIDPKQAAKYRESFTSGGAKCDSTDAALLARMVHERYRELKPLSLDDEPTRRLAALCQSRRQLVDERTSVKQNLMALLKIYFPLLLKLGEVDSLLVLEVAKKWPDPREFRRLHPGKLATLFRDLVTKNEDRIREMVALVRSTPLITKDGPVIESLVPRVAAGAGMIDVLTPQIEKLEKAIDLAFAKHPDAHLLEHVPGAGRAMAPRLLAALGSDRERYANADEVAVISGIAPITKQSGKTKIVVRRRGCPKFLKQTFHEFADAARKWCPWSRAYYQLLRTTRNMRHHAAVRKLARCWIRILYSVWKTRQPYDPNRYLQKLHAKNHPLLAFLPKK